MLDTLLRVPAAVGPSAIWMAKFCAAVVAVFVLYVGIVIWAIAARSRIPNSGRFATRSFRDLLDLFSRRRGR